MREYMNYTCMIYNKILYMASLAGKICGLIKKTRIWTLFKIPSESKQG